MTKESIKELVERGFTISFPYKREINQWYGDIKLYKYHTYDNGNIIYIIEPNRIQFNNIDDAINYYCNEALTSKNKGYIQSRLMNKGVEFGDRELENKSRKVEKIFKEEGKLIDEESKLLDITIRPMPTKKEFIKEIEKLIRGGKYTVEDFTDIKVKYISLDPYINFYVVFKYDNGNEYRISSSKLFNDEEVKKYKKYKGSKDYELTFDRFEITVSIEDYRKEFKVEL